MLDYTSIGNSHNKQPMALHSFITLTNAFNTSRALSWPLLPRSGDLPGSRAEPIPVSLPPDKRPFFRRDQGMPRAPMSYKALRYLGLLCCPFWVCSVSSVTLVSVDAVLSIIASDLCSHCCVDIIFASNYLTFICQKTYVVMCFSTLHPLCYWLLNLRSHFHWYFLW